MRQAFEDAAMVYRQEVDGFLTIIAPAALLGPILVIVATADLVAGLVTIPIFLLLYVATYAACLRAGGLVLRSLSPEAGRAYLDALRSGVDLAVTCGAPAGVLLAAGVSSIVLVHNDLGIVALALLMLSGAALIEWASRHAYDQALVLAFDAPAAEALRISSLLIDLRPRTLRLVCLACAPLAAAALVALWLGMVLAPPVGGAVFVLALAFWLPFPALVLTLDYAQLQSEPVEVPATEEWA
jgi:hypothetical protein